MDKINNIAYLTSCLSHVNDLKHDLLCSESDCQHVSVESRPRLPGLPGRWVGRGGSNTQRQASKSPVFYVLFSLCSGVLPASCVLLMQDLTWISKAHKCKSAWLDLLMLLNSCRMVEMFVYKPGGWRIGLLSAEKTYAKRKKWKNSIEREKQGRDNEENRFGKSWHWSLLLKNNKFSSGVR